MIPTRAAVTHRPVVTVFCLILCLVGVANFLQMPRREDPEITLRQALVITPWPGATAEQVEDLVTDPIEKAVTSVDGLKKTTSISRVGMSILLVELEDTVTDPGQPWDDVRAKVLQVAPRLPEGCGNPWVNTEFGDVFQTCLALHQERPAERAYTPRQLEVMAERIRDELELLESVSKVEFWGVQPERIYVEVDSADWAKIPTDGRRLRQLFAARNIVAPGGSIDTATSSFAIKPSGEFTSVEQIEDLVIDRLEGRLPVRLGDLPFTVERRYVEPAESLARVTLPGAPSGQDCIVIGVSMKSGRNISAMNTAVQGVLARLRSTELPPDIALTPVNDLPRQVNRRVESFVLNLAQGVAVVLGVALLMMGWRAALVMAAAVPLCMIAAFAVVPIFGVEMEQFSIASLIIALGLIVDNAIVVSDNILRLMRTGMSRLDAVVRGAHDLLVPVLTSTLTTIFAFLPLLLLPGDAGEYVRSLPIVVSTTLAISWFVAMLVTPILCYFLLKTSGPAEEKAASRRPFYDRFLLWCLNRKLVILGLALAAFVGAGALMPAIGTQFFPRGYRDQFFIDVWLPEGSSIAATDRVCMQVERVVREKDDGRLASAVTFVGEGGPRIMLTMGPEHRLPYFGFILVNTTDETTSGAYADAVREAVASIPGARVQVRNFRLGPPLKSPVEFRLSGEDADVLRATANEMVRVLKRSGGTTAAHHDWGASGFRVAVEIDADAANLAGVSNADVAVTMNSLFTGQPLTMYREGDHQVPVLLRTRRSHRSLSNVEGIYVDGSAGKTPLQAIARIRPTWQPSVIARRNRVRTVTIGGQVTAGRLANDVAAELRPQLDRIVDALPPGYFLETGGESEETVKAQGNMGRAMTVALLLIVLVLITQYNSVLKPMVILFTIPLAVIGVLVGLYVTGWAMGFMVMLGIVSLAGVVVNNAIVLIDVAETMVKDEGLGVRDAMACAGRLRIRPIFLTSLTTIGGLLPLALFGGPLWAGMAWGMIFGLVFSTVLTLVVVPTLYVLFAEKLKMKVIA